MHEILPSLRTLLVDHLATAEPLTADMPAGAKTVTITNTSRFRAGDEIFIMSVPLNKAEPARVFEVTDFETLTLFEPTVPGWTVANGSFVQKAIRHEPLKRVFLGDFQRIPDFPAITIAPTSESNEWWAIGATEHEHRVNIRVYVQTNNFEESEILLSKYARATREILLDHIHPIINDQTELFPLTADMPIGSTVVSISDTSNFRVNELVVLRDANPPPNSEENVVRTILSPTDLELATPVDKDFLVAREAEILRINRYLYDTRPSDINYGFVPGSGGSLLRAADISWFGKEVICRQGNILT